MMSFVRCSSAVALIWAGIAQPPAAHAQSVLADGGFDSQGGSVADFCYTSSCPAGSWTLEGLSGFIREHNPAWPAPPAISPQTIAFVQANNAIVSQTFSVGSAGSYVVSLWLASRLDHGPFNGNQRVAVEVNGQRLLDIQLQSGQSFRRHVSSAIQLSAGGGHTVRILGLAEGDVTAFIDNVAIVPAAGTTNYSYDARGRLTGVRTTGGANAGATSTYAHDRANNRTRVTVSKPN